MIKLLDRHMVTENALDIDGIMSTLIEKPWFVMEYMPFGFNRGWWWTRKRWRGRDSVVAFYEGFFRNFRSLDITPLRYTVSARGVVNSYRLQGRVLGFLPVRFTMAAFFEWDDREQKFTGERVYFSERCANKNL